MGVITDVATLKSCLEHTVHVQDEEIGCLVNAYLEDATIELPERVTRQFTILVELNHEISISITFPSEYSVERPQVRLQGSNSRDLQSDVNHRIKNLMTSKSLDTETFLFDLVQLVQDAMDRFDDAAQASSDTIQAQGQDATGEPEPIIYGRIMFYAHHLLAVSKRKDMQSMSKELDINILCKTGYPGLIAAEGLRGSIDVFIKAIKSMRWHTIALKYQAYQDLQQSEQWRNSALLESGYIETSDMSIFAKHFQDAGEWMQSIMH